MTDNKRSMERRLHTRFDLDGVVELSTGAEGGAVLRDISMSGLACLSPVAFDEMAILEINMKLPLESEAGGKIDFKAGGAVVRSEEHSDGQFLVAVFFTHMDDANRAALETFIEAKSGDVAS
jgi:hypothetical protein